jgi:predicted ArsR family transcriptional regulator
MEPGVPESETLVVFKILCVLAKARDLDHTLVADEIANELRIGKPRVEHFMIVLQQAGAVRAEAEPSHPPTYSLTRYGLERLAQARAH